MREEFRPAIEALQKDLADQERKVIETKSTINRLCELAQVPVLYPDAGSVSQSSLGTIRADTFYGKSLATALREYLGMRKAASLGPASQREIYENIKKGGFKFETTSEINALVGVRATLRKNSSMFHRLPNGDYGLLAWYPRAKPPKEVEVAEDEDGLDTEEPVEERPVRESKKAASDKKPTAA